MFVIAEAIIERRSGAFEPAGPSTALAFNMHASVVMLESPVTLIEAFDGHRWDSPPKIRFAPDSPLEGGVSSELVSEIGLFQRDSGR
jgi:hypothetical protein